ncbi:MAG: hypothetical protein V1913_13165 [Fibrobacterota bacterium]
MRILVYSLCTLAIFKIVFDILGGDSVAVTSVLIENIIFLIILAMIVRTYVKQREGRREKLQRKVNELNQMLNELK